VLHAKPDAVRTDAPSNEGLVQQLLEDNARLRGEVNRLELKFATAEGIAMGKAPLAEELSNRLKAAEERAERERKRHEACLASVEEKHKAQLELMELQAERRVCEMEAAHARGEADAAAQIAALTATAEPVARRKAPGEGRGPGRVKIREEVAFHEFKTDEFEQSEFLMHWEISSLATLHLKLGNFDIRRLKAYWDEDKQCTKRQAKQRAECFLNLLGLDTGKWRIGDVDGMFNYLLGSRDLGDQPGQFHNRRHQVASWLWPSCVSSYASLTASNPSAKYIDRRAHLYMTAVRGVHSLYEIYQGKRAMPEGFVEGVDPVPKRGPDRKRKAELDALPVPTEPLAEGLVDDALRSDEPSSD
jgi:hypothetical protein